MILNFSGTNLASSLETPVLEYGSWNSSGTPSCKQTLWVVNQTSLCYNWYIELYKWSNINLSVPGEIVPLFNAARTNVKPSQLSQWWMPPIINSSPCFSYWSFTHQCFNFKWAMHATYIPLIPAVVPLCIICAIH